MAIQGEYPTDREIRVMLSKITGFTYSFAISSNRQWNNGKEVEQSTAGFYQLMPDRIDDGFFDWYCAHRQYNQFFKRKADCTLEFINYHLLWVEAGKPKPFDNF